MECLREVTEWESPTPNHTYVLNKAGKCLAYRKVGGDIQVFVKPMMFDKKRRKFQKVVDTELLDAILHIS